MFNIYMLATDKKWIVAPFSKPFSTLQEAQKEVKELAKKLPAVKFGIHAAADHSKTAVLNCAPEFVN